MKTVNLLFLVLCVAIIDGCGDDSKRTRVVNLQQHVKDWMFFDTGTWWVYRELNSGAIDSQRVTKSEIINFENQVHRTRIKSQFARVHTNAGFLFTLQSAAGGSFIQKMDPNADDKSTFLFYQPAQMGSRLSSGNGFIEITGLDSHFTLDGIRHDTLITLFNNDDLTSNHDTVQYQVYKGVGIINKKNVTKKEEWQLLRYHVNLNKQ